MEMGKKTERQKAVAALDKIFSVYIRRRKADMWGNATCVTCFDSKPWGQQQCGHYYSRGKYGTRWDEQNCHVQCAACNVFRHGNYPAYAKYMYRLYGEPAMEMLELRSNSSPKFSVAELWLMVDDYTAKVLALDKTL